MRPRHVILAVGVVGVLGAGVWLGRTSSATADGAPAQPKTRTAELDTTRISPAPPSARVASPALATRTATIRGLAADLVDADPRVRRAAVREAGRGDAADAQAMIVASTDPDLEVAITATDVLGRMYAAGTVDVERLIERATDPGAPEKVRVTALNGLGLVASPRAGQLLTDLLARGSFVERASAAILLVHQEPAIAMPALIRALGDAEAQVRGNALEALRTRARGRDFGEDVAAWQAWWRGR